MGTKRGLTTTALQVLAPFVDEPTQERHGYELTRLTKVKAGSLYPILQRLLDDGYLEATWEEIDPVVEGRPPRRYYKITGHGVYAARSEREALARRIGLLRPGFAL